MPLQQSKFVTACLLSAFAVSGAVAQNTPAPANTPAPSFKAVFLNQLDDTEKKIESLAEAFPQEKYAWKPGDGVRSVSEVFLHEAGANYAFMAPFGGKMPANGKEMMKYTDKQQILSALKDSFANVRNIVSGLTDSDMSKEAKLFGRNLTYEDALFVYSNHLHEHLGQLIAYARENSVTPPWSKKEG